MFRTFNIKYCFIFISLLSISSCRTIDPVAPTPKMDEPEKLATHPESTVSIPIEMSLKEYYGLAENQVPSEFRGGEHPCEGVSFDYYFKRNPFELSAKNNKIAIDVSGKYWIKMSYCVSCSDLVTDKPICVLPRIPFSCGVSEPMRRMSLQYTTSFGITPDYSLETKTVLTDLKALDPCEVTVFKYDATEELLKEVRKALKDVAKDIDEELAQISFQKEAQGAWNMLNKPVKIKDFGVLHMNPSQVFLSEPKVNNDSLFTTLTLKVSPVFDYNSVETTAKLPDLNVIEKPQSDSFDLHILFKLNYDSLSTTLQNYAGGKQLTVKNKLLIFDSLSITGADNSELIIKVNFSGSKSGILYLRGTPKYDPVSESVQLVNISYDLATKSILLKTADWLFDDRIIEEIEKASKQDLKPEFEKLRKSINDSFRYSMKEYNVVGRVNSIKVVDLVTRPDEIRMLVTTTGNVKLNNFGLRP
jgi:hypothetical protein